MRFRTGALPLLTLMLIACEPQPEQTASASPSPKATIPDIFGTPPPAPRWYSNTQVSQGQRVYVQHCQLCHRPKGQGDPDWRRQRPDGGYPPPPLDGSAHAWHHPLSDLLKTVNQGHRAADGSVRMPAFGKTLGEAEKQAVIAYIQSLWPAAVYDLWHARVSGGKPSFKQDETAN